MNTREDQKIQVLQKKNLYESQSSIFHEDELAAKRFKTSSSNKNHLNDFRHFVLNRSRFINPSEVFAEAIKFFNKEDFKIKRIRKPLYNYLRISIIDSLTNNIILNGVKSISKNLEAIFREQSLKRRPDLEQTPVGETKLSSIISLNINGIKGKYNELMLMLEKRKPDIICLQETLRKETDKRLHINGYLVHEVPAVETGLGLVIGFRRESGLKCNILESKYDSILALVKGKFSDLIVGNVYRSPNPEKNKVTTIRIADILKKHSIKTDCILVGDWNEIPSKMTRKLLNNGVQVYTTHAPTKGTRIFTNRRRTKRPIDYGLSNLSTLIQSQKTRYNWMISDHLPVEIKINHIHVVEKNYNVIFDRKKLSDPKIANAIKNHKFDIKELNIIEGINKFHNELNKTLEKLKVIRTINSIDKNVHIPSSIKGAIKSKHKIDKKVRKGESPIEDLIAARKAIKKAISSSRRKSYLRFINEGIGYLKSNDSKNAWKWVNKVSNRSRYKLNVDQIYKTGTTEPETDQKERIKLWGDHFRKLSIAEPNQAMENNVILNTNSDFELITDSPFTWNEISSVLKSMRKGKAAGQDMIPGEVYKLVESEDEPESPLAKTMLYLLNSIYNKDQFPSEWKDCAIVPIYKKGDRLDPNNYRGIALINTLLKVITKIIAARLQTVCNCFGILKREQAGFITKEEGLSQVACLLDSCQRRRIVGKDTIVCFLDLKKAYDMVPHNRLIYKLNKVGLGKTMIKFIERMYDNTYMKVRINNILTESFRYERGVRQGCPTSPLLFNIYINDLLDDINPIEVPCLPGGLRGLMFADDTVILADSYSDLSEKLKVVKKWMTQNAMEVNPAKCGIMEIRVNPDTEPGEVILYNGQQIPKIDKYVYLGVEFNNTLDINEMAKFRCEKGRRVLYELIPTLRKISVPLEYKNMLIKSILIPTIHYGSEIFGMCESRVNSLKRILDNALKCIVKRSNFCRLRVYEEFDIKPLYVSAAISRARGLKKWEDSGCLISDLIKSQSGFKSIKWTWIKEAKRWLKVMKVNINNPLPEVLKQVAVNRTATLHTRDSSIIGEWATKIGIKSGKAVRKAEIHKKANYIGVNNLTKVRTGTFMFTNSLVRFGTIPARMKNKCLCCKEETLENAEHMLLYCSAFNRERKEILSWVDERLQTPQSEAAKSDILKKLLGEKGLTSGRKSKRRVLKTIKYLTIILPKRSIFIEELKGELQGVISS